MTAPGGDAFSLIEAVRELVAGRRTGVLDVRAGGVGTRIYFEAGKPVFAEDDGPGETFGRLLVRQGVITNAEFVRVIDAMTLAAKGDNPLRFGEVAVAQGVLTSEQVERGLADQVYEIIGRALARDESRWTFDASPSATKPPRSFAIDFASTHAARLAAEQAFQKGMALLRATRTAAAAVELRRAALLQPESLEYALCASWAEARSRSEIPSEADRRTLLEIAQRAKRRDPMFGFGSYVLGQLAMWAGDEAAAKKWFYEALRLDPASEAGREVRILARRGTGTLDSPSTAQPADRDQTMGEASPNRRAKWLLPGAVILATAALVMFAAARRSVPRAGRAPSSSLDPVGSEAGDASASPDGRRGDPSAGDPGTKTTRDRASPGDDRTTVRLPARASGHRIYVDGRRVQVDETVPLHLPCGPHVIQIGSRGTPQHIDLRCGGEVQLQ